MKHFPTFLIILICLLFAGTEFAQAAGTVTTSGGATWTYGTTRQTDIWYWYSSSSLGSRRTSEMTDDAKGGSGFYVATLNNGEIARVVTDGANNNYRVCVQKIKYSIPVPAYSDVDVSYTVTATTRSATSVAYYSGIELFDWGTTDHTTEQTYSTDNSETKSGKLNGVDYCFSSIRYYSSSGTKSDAQSRSWSFSNKTGASATTGNEYLAMMTFARSSASNRSVQSYASYSNEEITRTYYATVTFNANGGSGTMAPQSITNSAALTTNSFTRSGYVFMGWSTNASATSVTWNDGATFNAESNGAGRGPVTLYAIWGQTYYGRAESYSDPQDANIGVTWVSLNGNWPSSASECKIYDTSTRDVVSVNPPTVQAYYKAYVTNTAAYEFAGWYSGKNGTGARMSTNLQCTLNFVITSTSDKARTKIVYYAYFKPKSFTVSFDANGGSVSTSSKSVTYASTYGDLPTPTRTGYTFDGWFTAASGGTQVVSTTKVEITSSQTLYAHWSPAYYISFNANGGTGSMATQTVGLTDSYTLPNNAFTAPTYTISFQGNGGGATPAIEKTMTFNGWEDHGEIIATSGDTYTFATFDAPYYANKYSDLKTAFGYNKSKLVNHYDQYTVHGSETRIAKGTPAGTYPNQATVAQLTTTVGYTVPLYAQWTGTITLPAAPAASVGSTFTGWYDGYTKAGDAGDTYTVTGNVTLTAHWEASSYTLTIYNNGRGTIDGGSSKQLTMTYASTNNNSVSTSWWADSNTPAKYHYGKVIALIGDTYYDVFDKDGNPITDGRFFNADGRWVYPDNLNATTLWEGNVTTLTLDARPGGFKGTDAQTGQIEVIQESAQHFSDGSLNPFYAGYVFTGGYTGQNGTGYRVYRDGSRATTDGNYWHDTGTLTDDEPQIPILTWDRGDLTALTLYAHWVEAYFYYESIDGRWDTQDNWREYDADYGETGLLESHQPADVLPQTFNNVIISRAVTIDSEVACRSIKIVTGGSITIAPTGGLTVGEGGITGATKDNLRIQSSTSHQGYFRMSPSASCAMPQATVELATQSSLDNGGDKDATWQYFGVPTTVSSYTVDYITWMHEWSTASGWVDLKDNSAHALSPWKGYCVTQYGNPTYEWSGQLQGGNHTLTFQGEEATQGMNLIANSYAAPIDVKNFTAEDFDGSNMMGTFYIYNAGSWNQWKAASESTPTGAHAPGTFTAIPLLSAAYLPSAQTLIAPMQAIMIQLTNPGASWVKFDYEKHVWNANATSGCGMTDPVRAPRRQSEAANELTHRVHLSVRCANSGSDDLYLLEKPEFSRSYDNGYDAPKMATQGLVNIYSYETDGMMAVSATDDMDSLYVGFASGEDEWYTLAIGELIGGGLLLEDLTNGMVVVLDGDQEYTFQATSNTINDHRFLIRKDPNYIDVPTDVEQVTDEEGTTGYYTVTGQFLGTDIHNLPTGIYIRRTGSQCSKILIR